MDVDLLGRPINAKLGPDDLSRHRIRGRAKRKEPVPAGYAARPGSGPENETCGSCKHHARKRLARTYHKCGLLRAIWTGGGKTDIRVRSPACAKWEAE